MKPIGPMGWMLPIFLSLGCLAQGGEIRGWVLSTEGAPIPNAEISAKKLEGQFRQVVLTQPDGRYEVKDLSEGVYSLTVTGPGGQQSVRRIVVVGTPTSLVRMDFRLPLFLTEDGGPPMLAYAPDLNLLRRRLMVERGADPQPIREFLPEQNNFGAEFGSPLREFHPLSSRPVASQWRSSISDALQTSILNARSFFTVGPLPPARVNQYDLSASGPLAADRLSVTAQFGRLWDSGEVNGNVQAPKLEERTPLGDDPRPRALIATLLQAYGSGLPNFPSSPNISENQLNASAPQKIDSKDGLLRLDFSFDQNNSLAFLNSINDYAEDPFELVMGQNPQINARNLALHTSLIHNFSPNTVGRIGFHFDRLAASLSPPEEFLNLLASQGIAAAVPDVDFQADSLDDIGPGTSFPHRQVQNRFQLYGDATYRFGRHSLQIGGGAARVQVNDLQSDHARGTLVFAPDFGYSEIENFLLGRPALWIASSGDLYRGFRNWEHFLYVGDQIQLTPSLNLSLGLRYEIATAPVEVKGRTDVGYSTGFTNFAPRFGFAWNPARGNMTIRGGYGISYGTIFPATYQFARFNPPEVCVTEHPAPNLASLFFSPAQLSGNQPRCALRRLSADLVTPYSHQYMLSMEGDLPGSFFLRLSYMGTRSFHLFTQNISNRAQPLPGSPKDKLTTDTINDRRPDPRYYSIAEIESNSIAYYDAAQVSLQKRLSHGLTFRATYTFSKNIDLGGDFTNTASGVEKPPAIGIASSELTSRMEDLKGWSLLDTPHNLSLSYAYLLPSVGPLYGWKSLLLRGWEISGTTVFQSGLPFSVHTADGPGLGNVDGVMNDRPNVLNPSILGKSLDDPDTASSLLYYNPEDKTKPPLFDLNILPGGRGNIGYNVFRKDGTNNWNVSIGKELRFRGAREISVQFRVAFLNFFNHPQFDKPRANLLSPSFGLIPDTTNRGRIARLSVRVEF